MAKEKILYEEIMENILALPRDKYISRAVLYKYYKEGIFKYHPCLIYRCVSSIKKLRQITGTDKIKAKYTDYMTEENAKKRIEKRILTVTKWNKENISDGLIVLSKKYGKINLKELSNILKKENMCGKDVIRKHFGTVKKAFIELSLPFTSLHYMTNDMIIEQLQKLYNEHGKFPKCDINKKYHKIGILPTAAVIRKKFGSLDEAAEQANIEFCEVDLTNSLRPNIGKHEELILDIIEKENNISLIRQYGVGYYHIDGYDPLHNVAYEVDEKCHEKSIERDRIREHRIKESINCSFVRINEAEFLQTLKSLVTQ